MINLKSQFKKNSNFIQYKNRFNLIEIENLIDDNLFKKLQKNFPDEKYFSEHNDFAMSFSDEKESFSNFLDKDENWKNFIKKFEDQNFVNYLIKLFRLKNIYYGKSWKKYLPFYKESKVSFCFNISKNGGFSLPHTDSSRKLLSLVYFFVSDDWSKKDGGHINLYKPKSSKYEYNWRNLRVENKNLDVISTIIPRPNKIYGFKKTKNSYHSVEKVNSIDFKPRKVLMINLIYKNKSDSPFNEKKYIF